MTGGRETVGDEWLFTMEVIDGVTFHEYVRPRAQPGTAGHDETAPRKVKQRLLDGLGELDPVRLRNALYQLADGLHALAELREHVVRGAAGPAAWSDEHVVHRGVLLHGQVTADVGMPTAHDAAEAPDS